MTEKHPLRRGYNVVIMPDGQRIAPAVCTFDEQGRVISVEHLTSELPFVVWKGGIMDLFAKKATT